MFGSTEYLSRLSVIVSGEDVNVDATASSSGERLCSAIAGVWVVRSLMRRRGKVRTMEFLFCKFIRPIADNGVAVCVTVNDDGRRRLNSLAVEVVNRPSALAASGECRIS